MLIVILLLDIWSAHINKRVWAKQNLSVEFTNLFRSTCVVGTAVEAGILSAGLGAEGLVS